MRKNLTDQHLGKAHFYKYVLFFKMKMLISVIVNGIVMFC